MSRYTDIDKLIAEYDRVHIGPAGGARKLMVEAPIADVAPRAEVDRLRELNNSLLEAGQEWQKRYENLAREIFEEIEETLNRKIRRIEPEYERLDECFEKLSECGHSQHGYCKGVISTCEDLLDLLEELKKKYTEGEK